LQNYISFLPNYAYQGEIYTATSYFDQNLAPGRAHRGLWAAADDDDGGGLVVFEIDDLFLDAASGPLCPPLLVLVDESDVGAPL
jgi:hypothetical protein